MHCFGGIRDPSVRLRFILPFALCTLAGASPAFATTTVYVHNNTPFEFGVSVAQTGTPLSRSHWSPRAATLGTGKRETVGTLNREGGINSGRKFFLDSTGT
ncbi:MAG: hypothetical protein ACT4O5_07620, partial [Gammaproteobacteria bacterium]